MKKLGDVMDKLEKFLKLNNLSLALNFISSCDLWTARIYSPTNMGVILELSDDDLYVLIFRLFVSLKERGFNVGDGQKLIDMWNEAYRKEINDSKTNG